MKNLYVAVLIACIIGIFYITAPAVHAESTGVLTLDLMPDITTQTMEVTPKFQPMHIKVVEVINETEVTIWESDITEQKDINIPVPTGKYKPYTCSSIKT